MNGALLWLLLNLLSIVILAFYSMLEMACVSFNKARLEYYVSKGMKRAIWLNWLLQHPNRLFGTTLIGVNVATVFGSEFAREFYRSIHWNPDLSFLTQVIVVVVFGELAPMFAARRYAEHVALLGTPLVYASALIMSPIILMFGGISRICNWLLGLREAQSNIFLTQEELEKILEEQEEEKSSGNEGSDFNAVTSNIFNLRLKDIRQIMEPLNVIPKIPSNATVSQLDMTLRKSNYEYAALFHRDMTNIIGVAKVSDFVRVSSTKRVRDYMRSPWFVTPQTSIMQLLEQFRKNNEELAVILDAEGHAIGIISMEDIMQEVFGKTTILKEVQIPSAGKKQYFIDRTFPGTMKIRDFNAQFNVVLDQHEDWTLSEFILTVLGHIPEVGETVSVPPFELTVEETSMTGVKKINITTRRGSLP